jgi:hypothetical protein
MINSEDCILFTELRLIAHYGVHYEYGWKTEENNKRKLGREGNLASLALL